MCVRAVCSCSSVVEQFAGLTPKPLELVALAELGGDGGPGGGVGTEFGVGIGGTGLGAGVGAPALALASVCLAEL